MKSQIRVILATFAVLPLVLPIAGCGFTTLCVPNDPLLQASGARMRVTVPVTVKRGRQWCANGLVVRGKPKTVRLMWREEGESEDWAASDSNGTYVADNVGQILRYMIDVNALETPILKRFGKAEGPYEILLPETKAYLKGRELGSLHRSGQLRTYRLLIVLFELYSPPSETYDHDRDEFLRGFRTAYAEAKGDAELASRVVDVLKQSMSTASGRYREALAYGKRHVNNDVTDAEIERFIRLTINEPGCELGVKAGYIEGIVQGHPKPDQESSYENAELMYLSFVPLRRGSGR